VYNFNFVVMNAHLVEQFHFVVMKGELCFCQNIFLLGGLFEPEECLFVVLHEICVRFACVNWEGIVVKSMRW